MIGALEVGVDRVGLQRLQGERVDVAARRRDLRAEVAADRRCGLAVVGGQEVAVAEEAASGLRKPAVPVPSWSAKRE